MKFKILKPSKEGLKVFNPATSLHLKPEGEEVAMSNYWHRMIKCGDVVETKPAPEKKKETSTSKKNISED